MPAIRPVEDVAPGDGARSGPSGPGVIVGVCELQVAAPSNGRLRWTTRSSRVVRTACDRPRCTGRRRSEADCPAWPWLTLHHALRCSSRGRRSTTFTRARISRLVTRPTVRRMGDVGRRVGSSPAVGWSGVGHPRRDPHDDRSAVAVRGRRVLGCVGPRQRRSAAPVRRVRFAVDAVAATVDEAVDADADLLITHHPLLLRGVTSVAEDRYKGALLARLIRADCALISAHTNADVVEHGTSAVLARALGLTDIVADRPRRRLPVSASAESVGSPSRPRSAASRDASPRSSPRPRQACGPRADSTTPSRRSPSAGERATRSSPIPPCSRRRLHHRRPAPPSGLRGTRAGDARHRPRLSSTSRTGPASGSGSLPAPTSCAPPTPTSRSR